jgi:glycosyltransferase involved in cell wall biosynthesis
VGIDYRILAVGPGLIRRGLGRFTQQQLRAVLAVDHENEYVLLSPARADRTLVDPVIRRAPNVSVLSIPGYLTPAIGDGFSTRLRRSEQFQQWIQAEHIDLFHATTPFYPCEPMLSTFDACPMVATFYDVIPLLFPSHYFLGPLDKSIYAFTLSLLRAATRVIAISEATRQDAIGVVGVEPDRIDIAYPSVDGVFGPMPERDVDRVLARLSRRVRMPSRFAFTVSYPHHSKNLETLLIAYSRLPDDVRLRLPLVACCTVDDASPVVRAMARGLGISDDLVLTGPISDEEMAALYNRATFVVHPSRYEGFGLPLAEAMRCGTPVITTTSSCLPEIAGGAALLVGPDDVEAMTGAMLRMDGDGTLRADLAALGLVQSAQFDGAHLAAATLDCYRRAVGAPPPSPRRPRLAVWSPLPPAGGASARTTAELLDGLAAHCDAEVFVGDGAQPAFATLGRRPVHHASAFDRRRAQAGFDAVIYQVDDTADHLFVREAAAGRPGVAVLHTTTAGDGLLGGAQAVVVHDPATAVAIADGCPSVRVFEVPLGVEDPGVEALSVRRKAVRTELGCDDTTFVVALFAGGAGAGTVDAYIRAVAAFDGVMVLLAGIDAAEASRVGQLCARLGLAHRGADSGNPDLYAAGDALLCVGATGAEAREAVVRGKAAGRPAVLVPDSSDGGDMAAAIAELQALRADAGLLVERGASARADYEDRHTLAHSAAAYLDVIALVTGTTIDRREGGGFGPRPDAWDQIVQVLG